MNYRLPALAALLLGACNSVPTDLVVSPRASSPSLSLATDVYTTVGAATFTVPAGVTSLTITAVGAGGGGSLNAPGGSGANVASTLSVTPGQVLDLFVGGASSAGTNWNVGGGGSTNITSGGVPLVIAGGGGGAGNGGSGGSAGGVGGAGGNGGNSKPGLGGSGGIGGAGGNGSPFSNGLAGGAGNGGNGGSSATVGGAGGSGTGIGGTAGYYGGGGGGGYGGGGGGGSFSGGGAGGSFGPVGTTFASAVNGGPVGAPGKNGSIKITYEEAPPPPPVTCPEGYTDGSELQSLSVSSNGSSVSSVALIAGRPYLVQASGTYSFHIFRSDTWSDAYYRTGSTWATHDGPWALFALSIDGVSPDWGLYNSGHLYKAIYTGTGGPAAFRILDDAYGDNAGSLTATLFACNPISSPTTTSVTFGSGPFVYSGSAFTATASVSPAEAGAATITYSGDCTNAGSTCNATATYAGNGNFLSSGASTNIVIKLPVATSADQCKKGGWQFATDDLGNLFKNQGDCVSYVATKGKNKGAIAP